MGNESLFRWYRRVVFGGVGFWQTPHCDKSATVDLFLKFGLENQPFVAGIKGSFPVDECLNHLSEIFACILWQLLFGIGQHELHISSVIVVAFQGSIATTVSLSRVIPVSQISRYGSVRL
jgi:hypothetical protein